MTQSAYLANSESQSGHCDSKSDAQRNGCLDRTVEPVGDAQSFGCLNKTVALVLVDLAIVRHVHAALCQPYIATLCNVEVIQTGVVVVPAVSFLYEALPADFLEGVPVGVTSFLGLADSD